MTIVYSTTVNKPENTSEKTSVSELMNWLTGALSKYWDEGSLEGWRLGYHIRQNMALSKADESVITTVKLHRNRGKLKVRAIWQTGEHTIMRLVFMDTSNPKYSTSPFNALTSRVSFIDSLTNWLTKKGIEMVEVGEEDDGSQSWKLIRNGHRLVEVGKEHKTTVTWVEGAEPECDSEPGADIAEAK